MSKKIPSHVEMFLRNPVLYVYAWWTNKLAEYNRKGGDNK